MPFNLKTSSHIKKAFDIVNSVFCFYHLQYLYHFIKILVVAGVCTLAEWTVAGLFKMQLLDSVIKVTQRLKPGSLGKSILYPPNFR